MTTGIYCIYNKITGLRYIGASINIESRWSEHKSSLKYNTHKNEKLQTAYNVDGQHNFIYEIMLSGVAEEELYKVEKEYIDKYDTYYAGYNKTNITLGSSMHLLSVRSKHWGPLHGGSKYTAEQLIEAFMLLASTTKTVKEISCITQIPVPTIKYIISGGHEWLRTAYPKEYEKIIIRVPDKGFQGGAYTEKEVVDCFTLLLEQPSLTFTEISKVIGVPVETISAISSGRQYKAFLEGAVPGNKTREYYTLGKREYSKKYSKTITADEAKSISASILRICAGNTWLGRDNIERHIEVSNKGAIARKLSEFDPSLLDDLVYYGYTKEINMYINLRKTGRMARKISPELLIVLEKYNKCDDR